MADTFLLFRQSTGGGYAVLPDHRNGRIGYRSYGMPDGGGVGTFVRQFVGRGSAISGGGDGYSDTPLEPTRFWTNAKGDGIFTSYY